MEKVGGKRRRAYVTAAMQAKEAHYARVAAECKAREAKEQEERERLAAERRATIAAAKPRWDALVSELAAAVVRATEARADQARLRAELRTVPHEHDWYDHPYSTTRGCGRTCLLCQETEGCDHSSCNGGAG